MLETIQKIYVYISRLCFIDNIYHISLIIEINLFRFKEKSDIH